MSEPLAPARLSPAAAAGRLGRLVRKELSEILRDRRTILTLVLMPLLLYPVLGLALGLFSAGGQTAEAGPTYRLGFVSETDAGGLQQMLDEGERVMAREGVYQRLNEGGVQPGALTLPVPRLLYLKADDLEEEVERGQVEVGLRTRPGRGFQKQSRGVDCELLFREDSSEGREAARYIVRLLEAANASVQREQLRRAHGDISRAFLLVEPIALRPAGGKKPETILILVPLVLILMTITGAVYPAIDLTAGERERGTLEILMAAPIPRLSLLLAKYAAVVTVAVLTALVNLAAMALTLLLSGQAPRLFPEGTLSLVVLVEIFLLLLLFAAFFSAVLLVLTSFARSFKEAQAYLIPLVLLSLVPGMLSLWPGLPLEGPLLVVPLLNTVLLGRDLLLGKAEPLAALVVVVSTLAYALGAIALAARLFGADAVRAGQGGWFRRRRPAQTT
jgi:ABC-2 type transport system permease protein/sodium transport system permease protein